MIEVLTTKQTANLLGISHTSLRTIMARGEISFCRVGKKNVRFTEIQIREYLEKHSVKHPAGKSQEAAPVEVSTGKSSNPLKGLL